MRIFYDYGDRVVEMKDGEKAMLALAAVVGALYMSKTKTNNGRISQPSRNATLVARQPRGIQAYAPIEGLAASHQKSAQQIMRENKAKKANVPSQLIKLTTQKEMMELMFSWSAKKQAEFRSMKTDADARVYLAKEGYTN